MSTGRDDVLQVRDYFFVFIVFGIFLEHFGIADNGIHRCTQLVAHIGEEGALGFIRGLGLFTRDFHLALHLLAIGNIDQDAEHPTRSITSKFKSSSHGEYVVVPVVGEPGR